MTRAKRPSAEPVATPDLYAGPCKPGGPYCRGMSAALAVGAAKGLAVSVVMNKNTLASRDIITHGAVADGKKTRLLLGCCPFCRADLTAPSTASKEKTDG